MSAPRHDQRASSPAPHDDEEARERGLEEELHDQQGVPSPDDTLPSPPLAPEQQRSKRKAPTDGGIAS